MAVESIAPNEAEADSELIMCKFAQIDSKKDLSISIKEKGKFALTVTLGKLDARIQSLQESIANADQEVRVALQNKNRGLASTQLLRKKRYEKELEKLWGQRQIMEEQLLNLESNEDTAHVLETMSVASSANRATAADAESIDQALSDLQNQREEMDRLNSMFNIKDDEQEELMRELEKLSLSDGDSSLIEAQKSLQDQEKLEFAKLDAQLNQYMRELDA